MMYIVGIEAVVIIGLLAWEIFWLRKVWMTLNRTSDSMEKVIENIKKVVTQLEQTSSPLANLLKMFNLQNGSKK